MLFRSIVSNAEASCTSWGHASEFPQAVTRDDAISMTLAARELAHDRNVACIAVFTVTGKTALLMSKARPQVPILAFTPDQRTYQRMNLYWGVVPFLVPHATTVESMLTIVEQAILSFTEIQPGAQAVVIASFPVGTIQPPNLALLHTIRAGH